MATGIRLVRVRVRSPLGRRGMVVLVLRAHAVRGRLNGGRLCSEIDRVERHPQHFGGVRARVTTRRVSTIRLGHDARGVPQDALETVAVRRRCGLRLGARVRSRSPNGLLAWRFRRSSAHDTPAGAVNRLRCGVLNDILHGISHRVIHHCSRSLAALIAAFVVFRRATPCHAIPRHATSRHATSFHPTPFDPAPPRRVKSPLRLMARAFPQRRYATLHPSRIKRPSTAASANDPATFPTFARGTPLAPSSPETHIARQNPRGRVDSVGRLCTKPERQQWFRGADDSGCAGSGDSRQMAPRLSLQTRHDRR